MEGSYIARHLLVQRSNWSTSATSDQREPTLKHKAVKRSEWGGTEAEVSMEVQNRKLVWRYRTGSEYGGTEPEEVLSPGSGRHSPSLSSNSTRSSTVSRMNANRAW